jgi:hypothetical protein
MTSNSKVTIEVDREVAEFLAKTGYDAMALLVGIGVAVPGMKRKDAKIIVGGIENWKKIRAAIRAAGVQLDD